MKTTLLPAILSIAFLCTNTFSLNLDIQNELTFQLLAGAQVSDILSYPSNYPFDCRMGFGYSVIFTKLHLNIDGDLLYSVSELINRKTRTLTIFYDSLNGYQEVRGETYLRSLLISGNIVPCFFIENTYAGFGLSIEYRSLYYTKSNIVHEPSISYRPYICAGYRFKYVQVGAYMNDFVQFIGIFIKANIFTIKKSIHKYR
jgi:hypothetical protein